ncbi:MAG TPA: SIR2 family protein [Saprospiraceae bacterium]|nr:SIR2 family protein [Saprospiraceae bacterium]
MPVDPNIETYQTLARKVRDGGAVLFLGPNAILAKDSQGAWAPVTDLCARYLLEKYNFQMPPDEESSLPHVTSTLRIKGISSENLMQDEVAKFYASISDSVQLHPMLEWLTDLKFRMVINTTPDSFVTALYDDLFRAYETGYYNYYKNETEFNFDFKKNSVLVYNLFGHFQKPDSLVLTYKQQLAYIKKIVSEQQNARLPDALTNAFRDYRTHIFLGFDFEDWNMRLLLDTLYKNSREQIQPYSYPSSNERKPASDTRVFYRGEFGMEFSSVDMLTFAEGLREADKNLDNPAAPEVLADTPKAQVFIWHNDSVATDQGGCDLFVKHLSTIHVKIWTLRDAVGQGDVAAWMRGTLDQCQAVLPLISADFFSPDGNPAIGMLDEVVMRNNPRKKFLVMPVLLSSVSLEGPLAQLDSIRPLDRKPLMGSGKENSVAVEITEGLKKYLNRP